MAEEEKESEIITTVDEDGNELKLKLYDIVVVDDVEYALLLPADADENDDETELVLMRLTQEGEEYVFESIEDDDEFDLVSQAIIDDAAFDHDDIEYISGSEEE